MTKTCVDDPYANRAAEIALKQVLGSVESCISARHGTARHGCLVWFGSALFGSVRLVGSVWLGYAENQDCFIGLKLTM